MIDFKEIAAAALSRAPGIVQTWLPGGKLMGQEYRVGNLRGDKGDSLSVNCRTGKWADFAGDAQGGDLVSLYAAIHGFTNGEAAKELAAQFNLGKEPPARKPRPAPPKQEQAEAPKNPMTYGADPKANFRHSRHGEPSGVWTYKTLEGKLIGYIARYDVGDKKEIVPYTHRARSWVPKQFDEPRPLYNLPALSEKPTANVLLVEGEKCADHAARLFPKLAVVTWPGGSKAIGKVNWQALAGRKVAIWPDNDAPGLKAAEAIAGTLLGLGASVRFVIPPDGMPKGWDVADSDLTPDTAMQWIKDRMAPELPKPADEQPPEQEAPPLEAYSDIQDRSQPVDIEEPAAPVVHAGGYLLQDAPFQCLGHDKGQYFYFAAGTQQITVLTSGMHTKSNLLQLAPLVYWRAEFPKGKTGDIDIDSASDCMMRACERAGIFSIDRVRGRGAWWDDGHVAIHLGDKIVIGDDHFQPSKVKSRYIYEASQALAGDITNPLSNKEANRFISFLEVLAWTNPMYVKLAAGWCVVSHIGGALDWRPHIWVVGNKGSGKSWFMGKVIKPILGQNCLFVQSNSSEAGIRQTLGFDSLPVLFDEAEGETAEAQANMQRVLGLIRQSSSETGGKIAKGTPGGKAQRFMIRSCFALSAINAAIVQQSDKSRVSVLELSADYRRMSFEDIKTARSELLTFDYIAGFYARAIKLAPVIRQNAITFAEAAAQVFGEQRAGDQIGTLLAGAYSLYSDKIITYDAAMEWLRQQDWTEQKDEIKGESDEKLLWSHLLSQSIRIKLDGHNGDKEFTIGQLIDIARREKPEDHLMPASANNALQIRGIKAEESGVYVSNTNQNIKKLLKDSSYPVNWARVLKRMPGAESVGMMYFGYRGSESRAVFIPL